MSAPVPDNFLGLPAALSTYDTARFAVLPIPYDATTSYSVGTRDGPRAIISASQQVELYDEHLGREALSTAGRPRTKSGQPPRLLGVATLEPVYPDVRGPQYMVEAVYRAARKPVKDGKFLIGLGGEHSITAGLVRAVKESYKNISVLQIDAHADLRDEYQGSPWSHACVMRRIYDMGIPAVGFGIRNYSLDEAKFIKSLTAKAPSPRAKTARGEKNAPTTKSRAAYTLFTARYCHEAPELPQHRAPVWGNLVPGSEARSGTHSLTSAVSRSWIGDVVGPLSDDVYITIDIDAFDPAYAPGTGTPEPGGLDWYQVTELLEAVARSRRIVAADVVEVRPIPPNTVTEFLAAKLIYRLIGLV